jgi:hypothetical protein
MDGDVRNGYRILVENLEGKKLFGRLDVDRIILKWTLCSIIHPPYITENFSS